MLLGLACMLCQERLQREARFFFFFSTETGDYNGILPLSSSTLCKVIEMMKSNTVSSKVASYYKANSS